MKLVLLITLCFAVTNGFLTAAGSSDWEIVKIEAAKDRPGYQNITVRNVSKQPQELTRHWHFQDVVSANVCFESKASLTSTTSRFLVHSGAGMTLFAEPCHYPNESEKFIKVQPGESVKAILPTLEGFHGVRLSLVLSQKKGRIVVGTIDQSSPSVDSKVKEN